MTPPHDARSPTTNNADQRRLTKMLDSMAGVVDGVRDALTNYTRPLTGAFYFIPSVEALGRFLIEPPT